MLGKVLNTGRIAFTGLLALLHGQWYYDLSTKMYMILVIRRQCRIALILITLNAHMPRCHIVSVAEAGIVPFPDAMLNLQDMPYEAQGDTDYAHKKYQQ